MFLRTTFFLFKLINVVFGQSCAGVVQVHTVKDLDFLARCNAFSGTISVSGTQLNTLSIPSIQHVDGIIEIQNNPQLTSLSLPNLKSSGTVILNNNSKLVRIEVPQLIQADTFKIQASPDLKIVAFPAQLTNINNIEVSGTGIEYLNGVEAGNMNSLVLSNNPSMSRAEFQLLKSGSAIMISNNGGKDGIEFTAPNLSDIGQANFQNLGSVAMPSLTKVDSSIGFKDNPFSELSLPSLMEIGTTLEISGNKNLKKADFPNLKSVNGDFVLASNPKLAEMKGFDHLSHIGGDVDITGDFSKLSLPSLNNKLRSLNVETRSAAFDCDGLNSIKDGIGGDKFNCKSGVKEPQQRHESVKDVKSNKVNKETGDKIPDNNKATLENKNLTNNAGIATVHLSLLLISILNFSTQFFL